MEYSMQETTMGESAFDAIYEELSALYEADLSGRGGKKIRLINDEALAKLGRTPGDDMDIQDFKAVLLRSKEAKASDARDLSGEEIGHSWHPMSDREKKTLRSFDNAGAVIAETDRAVLAIFKAARHGEGGDYRVQVKAWFPKKNAEFIG